MKKIRACISLVLIVVFLLSGSLTALASDYGAYLNSMLHFMQGMYYKGLTDEEGLKTALKGMFSGLDKYSAFYDMEETESMNNSLSSNYIGIGAGLEKEGTNIRITKIYEDSPAEKAGLHEGDVILAVDGKSVEGIEAEAAAAMIKGESGTKVILTIMRNNTKREFTIIRGQVVISSVHYRIEGSIAYIRIDRFISGTGSKFKEAIDEVNDNQIRKIVLDLRGNPGGYVDEAVAVAKKLIKPGIITTLDYKSEEVVDQVYTSKENNPDYIIAVLIDESSASASEILAGALEDAGNGILIGQKSFGKGVFQSMFSILTPEAYNKYGNEYNDYLVTDAQWRSYYSVKPKKDEFIGSVKLTTGYYLTPKGRSLDGIGLKPVIYVPNRSNPNGVDLSLINPLTGSAALSKDTYHREVYHAESILKAAGYFTNTSDKYFDTAAVDAVKQLQEVKGLPITGAIDMETKEELNTLLVQLRGENDKQYAKAVEVLGWFGKNTKENPKVK